jgi:hypothetical protein
MPALGELGNLPNVLSNSLISNSPLWKREASTIKKVDLFLFLRQYKDTEQYGSACREVEKVTVAGLEAIIDGAIEEGEFAFFQQPKVAFISDELCEWLSGISLTRCHALLFALEMEMDPKTVIGLEWKDLSRFELTPVAKKIVDQAPRHMKLKYVFWDYLTNGSAAPLFGLGETALEVSQGLGFDVLQNLYNNLVIIDTEADLEGFLKHFNLKWNKQVCG